MLLIAARCFLRLHFSLRGLPEDLRALSVALATQAMTMAQAFRPAVRCEACGAEELLPREYYPRAERIKVRSHGDRGLGRVVTFSGDIFPYCQGAPYWMKTVNIAWELAQPPFYQATSVKVMYLHVVHPEARRTAGCVGWGAV